MKLISFFILAGSLLAQGPRKAPGFSLPDTSRTFYDLSDYRGKVVVLEVMGTTCPHCKAFSGVLEEINKKYPGRVQVLAIVNPPDTLDTVNAYVAATKVTFPMLFDCGQAALSYVRAANVEIPRVFIIDRNGMIREDVSYNTKTTAFFEKRGIFASVDRVLALK